jgi:hypothetical protein
MLHFEVLDTNHGCFLFTRIARFVATPSKLNHAGITMSPIRNSLVLNMKMFDNYAKNMFVRILVIQLS